MAAFDVIVTFPPAQNVVAVPEVIAGVNGRDLTLNELNPSPVIEGLLLFTLIR